jgi:anti-anti-sigma factor
MQLDVSIVGDMATLRIEGRFDYKSQSVFRSGYEPLLDQLAVHTICVDLSKIVYMDSSALGILMVLREKALLSGKEVRLGAPTKTARQILEIANFEKLFKIS